MAGDYRTTGVAFEGMDVDEIRVPIVGGVGHGAIGAAVDSYRWFGDSLRMAGDGVARALSVAQVAHTGAAGTASAEHVTSLVGAGDRGQAQAKLAAWALEDTTSHYIRVRNDVQALVVGERSATPTSYEDAMRQAAVEAAQRYQTNANDSLTRTFQPFTPPGADPVPGSSGGAGAVLGAGGVGAGRSGIGFDPSGVGGLRADGAGGAIGVSPGAVGVAPPIDPAATGAGQGSATGNTGAGGVGTGPGGVPVGGIGGAGGNGGAGTGAGVVGAGGVGTGGVGAGRVGPGGVGPSRVGLGGVAVPGRGTPGTPGTPGSGRRGAVGVTPAGGWTGRTPGATPSPQRGGRHPDPWLVPDDDRAGVTDGVIAGRPVVGDGAGTAGGTGRGADQLPVRPPAGGATGGGIGHTGAARPDAAQGPAAAAPWVGRGPGSQGGEPGRGAGTARPMTGPMLGGMPMGGGMGGQDREHPRPPWLVEDDPEQVWMGHLPPHTDAVLAPDPEDRP